MENMLVENDLRLATDTVVLLTACIDPGTTIAVRRKDPATRLNDYKVALKRWLTLPGVQSIVFCENSGYDLAEIESVYKDYSGHNKSLELLSFRGQDFPSFLGKGYGEMGIIRYALDHSRIISSMHSIMKVTGRFFIPNAGKILNIVGQRKGVDIFCDLRNNLLSSDSRVFCATVEFIRKYLLPYQDLINDSAGMVFEDVLARAAHRAMADGRKWEMMPCAHHMIGISGTNNESVPGSRLNLLKRELFRRMKSIVLNR